MDWKVTNNYFGGKNKSISYYDETFNNTKLVKVIIDNYIKLLKSKKNTSNLIHMFNLKDANKMHDFLTIIKFILNNSVFNSEVLKYLLNVLSEVDSCALIMLIIFYTSIYVFFENSELTNIDILIRQIKQKKMLFLTKFYLFIESFRLFFSSYFSIPKSIVDNIFQDIKPYSNVEANGITALDLTQLFEKFMMKNNLYKVANFLGVFYTNSNYDNWIENITNSNVSYQFGVYATGIPSNPKHWVSFLLDKSTNIAYLYDSCNQYAFSESFMFFLEKLNYKVKRTYKMHQFESNYCGLYCLVFLAMMLTKPNLDKTFDEFFIKNGACLDEYMNDFGRIFYTPNNEIDDTNSTQVLMFIGKLLNNII